MPRVRHVIEVAGLDSEFDALPEPVLTMPSEGHSSVAMLALLTEFLIGLRPLIGPL